MLSLPLPLLTFPHPSLSRAVSILTQRLIDPPTQRPASGLLSLNAPRSTAVASRLWTLDSSPWTPNYLLAWTIKISKFAFSPRSLGSDLSCVASCGAGSQGIGKMAWRRRLCALRLSCLSAIALAAAGASKASRMGGEMFGLCRYRTTSNEQRATLNGSCLPTLDSGLSLKDYFYGLSKYQNRLRCYL